MKSFVLLIWWFLAATVASINSATHSIVYNQEHFSAVLRGASHVIIALGTQTGQRLYAAEGRSGFEVKLRKPEKQNEPDPNELWLLEPCNCHPTVRLFRIKHLQSDKYLAIAQTLHEKYYHTVTLVENKRTYSEFQAKNIPYDLEDLKLYWEISPMGSYIRNVYYNEYLIPEKATKPASSGPQEKEQAPDTQNLYAGSKPDRDSYWITFSKSALLYTPPPNPVAPGNQQYPQYPGAQPKPFYPGAAPFPAYPGAQPYPGYPAAQPLPPYPGAQGFPTLPAGPTGPSNQPMPQFPVPRPNQKKKIY